MIKKLSLFLVLVSLSFTVYAQNFLVLEKMGTKKRFEFHIGEQMEIMLNDDDYFTRITILGLKDSLITTEFETLTISNIKAVRLLGKSRYLKNWGPPLIAAGVILFGIDIINQTTGSSSGAYSPSVGITTASATLVVVGTIFTFAGKDKINLKKWWRLRIVELQE
jgi:hypothetical protein